ncbi:GldM family protein [Roseivirga pacifica]|uniref:type IX secretion system motor protein PorM/GldM n=1 Tax=Roseivirga pacifica TaxID=1267423 RepID=UPI00227AFC9C|nr:GldM family protein [Roseivirga pacifica]
MAGGKETPRQKMIGMMYLVLTALLALQIKDSVLEKFVLIENGLKESNEAFYGYNADVLTSIQSDVANQGNKEGDQAVAKAAENIRKYTNGIVATLDNFKYEVGKISSGGDTAKVYQRSTLKKYEEPSLFLVEQKNAEKLKEELDAYAGQINRVLEILGAEPMNASWSESLAKDANDIPFYANNQEEKKKDYAHFNFYKAPLASVLAQLTFYKNQLYSKESEVLNKLRGMVGTGVSASRSDVPDLGGLEAAAPSSNPSTPTETPSSTPSTSPSTSNPGNASSGLASADIKEEDYLDGAFRGIDYAQATILSSSNTVTAGLDFEAQAFLTLGNSSLEPEVKLNGEKVDVVNGRGVIKFKTSAAAGEYDANDLATKSFEVEITADDGTGSKITRTTRHEYNVARPVIEVESNAVQVLYRDCANDVTINVPSLGPAYNPEFRLSAGSFEKGADKGNIVIAPKGNEVELDVYSSGLYIGKKTFPVRSAPTPKMSVLPNGQAYAPEEGFSGTLNNLTLSFSVDSEWRAAFPEDASYLVSKGEILIVSGNQVARTIRISSPQGSIDMNQHRSILRPGVQVIVKVEEVVRINFKGDQIATPVFDNATITLK